MLFITGQIYSFIHSFIPIPTYLSMFCLMTSYLYAILCILIFFRCPYHLTRIKPQKVTRQPNLATGQLTHPYSIMHYIYMITQLITDKLNKKFIVHKKPFKIKTVHVSHLINVLLTKVRYHTHDTIVSLCKLHCNTQAATNTVHSKK